MKPFLLGVLVALGLAFPSAAAPAPAAKPPATEEQKARLRDILRLLPKSEPWEKWLVTSGAMPPDFNALPSIPFLPDPLKFSNGRDVKVEEWLKRRAELLALFQHYITGTWPASPGNTRVADFNQREEAVCIVQEVTLEFGPNHAAKLHLEVIIPNGAGP
jgi:hypothetical protein